jgi:hypothetical protein
MKPMTQTQQPSPPNSRKWQILIISLMVIGLLLIGFFGLRAVRSYIRIQQTGLEQGVTDVELIRGWMTIPYIAKAYQVPEDYLFEQLNLPAEGNRHKSIADLNRTYDQGQPGVILEAVKAAIRRYQAEHPQPTRGRP